MDIGRRREREWERNTERERKRDRERERFGIGSRRTCCHEVFCRYSDGPHRWRRQNYPRHHLLDASTTTPWCLARVLEPDITMEVEKSEREKERGSRSSSSSNVDPTASTAAPTLQCDVAIPTGNSPCTTGTSNNVAAMPDFTPPHVRKSVLPRRLLPVRWTKRNLTKIHRAFDITSTLCEASRQPRDWKRLDSIRLSLSLSLYSLRQGSNGKRTPGDFNGRDFNPIPL